MSNGTLAEVVSFWREAGPERWFGKDNGFDLTIRSQSQGRSRQRQRPGRDVRSRWSAGIRPLCKEAKSR
jgi:uncharacterized protein (DUF924 family)